MVGGGIANSWRVEMIRPAKGVDDLYLLIYGDVNKASMKRWKSILVYGLQHACDADSFARIETQQPQIQGVPFEKSKFAHFIFPYQMMQYLSISLWAKPHAFQSVRKALMRLSPVLTFPPLGRPAAGATSPFSSSHIGRVQFRIDNIFTQDSGWDGVSDALECLETRVPHCGQYRKWPHLTGTFCGADLRTQMILPTGDKFDDGGGGMEKFKLYIWCHAEHV